MIDAVLKIHCAGDIELDAMFNKGSFYKSGLVKKPPIRFDLNASKNRYDALDGDAANLPIESASISTMILDPPFMFGAHGNTKERRIAQRYTIFQDWNELEICYKGILREAHRVLKKNGVLIFKCQDYTDGKTTLTHCYVWQWAEQAGFYAKDLAILNLNMVKIYNPFVRQRHFRKTHCYFFVFVAK